MIIVSQDKRKTINFDKVERIEYINNDGQKEFMEKSNLAIFTPIIEKTTGINFKELKDFGIYVYFSSNQAIMIGQYETEERAKEVLQEMLKQKAMFELYKLAPTGGKVHAEMLDRFAQKNIIFDTYEMPKE